jgi:polysaccharide biosynthesis/export protein
MRHQSRKLRGFTDERGLKGADSVLAVGKTLAELSDAINLAYSKILREPQVRVTLKDFDKPYFIVSGEVTRPGKYELRSETKVIEAVAIAGGFTSQARHSETWRRRWREHD